MSWKESGEDRKIVNLGIVYAPYDGRRKTTLWSELSFRIELKKEKSVSNGRFQCNRKKMGSELVRRDGFRLDKFLISDECSRIWPKNTL